MKDDLCDHNNGFVCYYVTDLPLSGFRAKNVKLFISLVVMCVTFLSYYSRSELTFHEEGMGK